MPRSTADSGASIPEASVARLACYLHILRSLSAAGIFSTSSGQLAGAAGVNPAILRKDLSHVGANGVRGVGYDVARLTARIAMALHSEDLHNVALAGAGNLGRTLLMHAGLGRGFRVVAMFDTDPHLIGTTFAMPDVALTVAPMTELVDRCRAADVGIAVMATADDIAQQTCDAFVTAGVRQILDLTTVTLDAPPHVHIRPVDLGLELQILAFNASCEETGSQAQRSGAVVTA
ncbi:redox-sensing transcriptional repressor Rex [Williamsia sp. CHRR-6]|uniref:redox-sensing transcriptional repressor Rex n=1 Tax=Williamsia sp. CHRR-6 TaxID=2835871 RepID=UPI001BDA522B|nr:redox-sensing transcriptional repressor Rex [Williamsia sp. CHRR-6]MBT0565981.1 redox-sensing transcriptional repressor Rex [Williamsia sp. CHRR-6]